MAEIVEQVGENAEECPRRARFARVTIHWYTSLQVHAGVGTPQRLVQKLQERNKGTNFPSDVKSPAAQTAQRVRPRLPGLPGNQTFLYLFTSIKKITPCQQASARRIYVTYLHRKSRNNGTTLFISRADRHRLGARCCSVWRSPRPL